MQALSEDRWIPLYALFSTSHDCSALLYNEKSPFYFGGFFGEEA
jgi:hypothetical protein